MSVIENITVFTQTTNNYKKRKVYINLCVTNIVTM